MTQKIHFIIGGARSGKSSFAEKLAEKIPGKRAYIATAQALDEEMAARIEMHRNGRTGSWDTFEEPLDVPQLFGNLSGSYELALLDCLTLWLSNVMGQSDDDSVIISTFDALVESVREFKGSCIVVSNEVGLGIVPDNPLARRFRDYAGILNQKMATVADAVYFTAAGIPVKIK